MALWYQPRQLLSGLNAGKWHYTACSDESSTARAYPVGACANDCPGHDTPEGAERHNAEGICAGEIRERDDATSQLLCIQCQAWTQHRALLSDDAFPDEYPICATGHDIRAALRCKHFERRRLTP